jgi:hypothetical protein
MEDFRRIPFFRNYLINKRGEVLNAKTLQKLTLKKNGSSGKCQSYTLTSDNGNKTTREIKGLIKLVWGESNGANWIFITIAD